MVGQLRKGTLACQVAVGATVNACAAHAWYWGLAALSAPADMYSISCISVLSK